MSYKTKYQILLVFVLTMSLHCIGWANIVELKMIPFIKSDGLMLLEAEVDGKVGHLIFDTGSDALIINEVSTEGNQIFETINGEVLMQSHEVTDLSIGKFNFTNVPAFRKDLSKLINDSKINLLGIIGTELFSTEILHIDNENNIIQLYSRSHIESLEKSNFVKSPMESYNDILLIPIRIEDQSFNFMLDSGASISCIDEKVIRAFPTFISKSNKSINLNSTASSKDNSDLYSSKSFKISNLSIEQLEMCEIDLSAISKELNIAVDGVLSIDQLPFKEIIIDYHHSTIYFVI